MIQEINGKKYIFILQGDNELESCKKCAGRDDHDLCFDLGDACMKAGNLSHSWKEADA